MISVKFSACLELSSCSVELKGVTFEPLPPISEQHHVTPTRFITMARGHAHLSDNFGAAWNRGYVYIMCVHVLTFTQLYCMQFINQQ